MEADTNDVLMYVADLQTGWIRAGQYSCGDMDVARSVACQPNWPQITLPLVADLVSNAAGQGASESEPITLQALGLAMAAAAVSGTRHIVLQDRGSCAGHWFFLVYTAKDGAKAWNTAFAGTTGAGFLGGSALATFLQQVLRANLAPGAPVGERMAAGGGVDLAPNLELVLSQTT